MRLNILTGQRTERLPLLYKELQTQGITDYDMWDGVYLPSVKASINAAHRQIVEYARLAEWDMVCIAEDDIKFSAPGAWDYFLKNLPDDFDIYLGGIFLGNLDDRNIVKDFTGLTLYVVANRFYDIFLSVDKDDHLDRCLSEKGKFVVCNPFVATQHDGLSSNTGKHESYEYLQRDRKFFY